MSRWIRLLVSAVATTALLSLGVASVDTSPALAAGTTAFVAPTGSDTANTCVDSSAPCKTIGHALSVAVARGYTIQLAPGTYAVADNPAGAANVIRITEITIQSDPILGTAANTIIDATGETNGLVINANNATVKNVTITHADQDGILVMPPSNSSFPSRIDVMVISGNRVTDNGAVGIHMRSVGTSTIDHNTVTGNRDDGIVLTDEGGNSVDDTIAANDVSDNAGNGIVLEGRVASRLGGVIAVGVEHNSVNRNGEAGIEVMATGPGVRSSGNYIGANFVGDNGRPGIVVEGDAPSQNLDSNYIGENRMGRNGLTGNRGHAGDRAAGVHHTTAILVRSSASPLTEVYAVDNIITDVFYGVWLSGTMRSATVLNPDTTVLPDGVAIYAKAAKANVVGLAPTPSHHGYWQVDSAGAVFPFGDAGYYGSTAGVALNTPIVGIAPTRSGLGYYLVASGGGIFPFGDAHSFGSMGGRHLVAPVVGMAVGPGGSGYWEVASDGGIFAFGTAHFYGSMGGTHINSAMVAITAQPKGGGYWTVAGDGGIFSFGTAKFHGSMGGTHINSAMSSMTATGTGGGYWTAANDGGVFTFGDAHFFGSDAGKGLAFVSTIARTESGLGYWTSDASGAAIAHGDARDYGSEADNLAAA